MTQDDVALYALKLRALDPKTGLDPFMDVLEEAMADDDPLAVQLVINAWARGLAEESNVEARHEMLKHLTSIENQMSRLTTRESRAQCSMFLDALGLTAMSIKMSIELQEANEANTGA